MELEKEFRIGNWYDQFGVYHQVNWVVMKELSRAPKTQLWCKPIPITPEILENAGFVYKQTGNEVYEQEWVIDGHCLIWGPTSKDSFCHDMHTGGEIKYLHQLQNLYFALTGEELQIDL